ncbi:MAG: fliO [Phycisphaerales bacterium]|nr:fliO [Phycisphaerales bacterium]
MRAPPTPPTDAAARPAHTRRLAGVATLLLTATAVLAAASAATFAQATGPGGVAANSGPPAGAMVADPPATQHAGTAPSTSPAAASVTPAGNPSAMSADELNALPLRRPAAGDPGPGASGGSGGGGPPAKSTPGSPSQDAARVGLALVAVIGLILLLRWCSRRVFALPGAGSAGQLMQVVARTPLAPRQQLMLVRVGRRLMVIGDSGGRLSGLGHIEDPDEVAALLGRAQSSSTAAITRAGAAPFAAVLKRLGVGSGTRDSRSPEDLDDADLDTRRTERTGLFGTLDQLTSDDSDSRGVAAGDTAPHGSRPSSRFAEQELADEDIDGSDRQPSPRNSGEPDEEAAKAAVEAARHDIQSLRARLREMTERLTERPANDSRAADGSGRDDGEPTVNSGLG